MKRSGIFLLPLFALLLVGCSNEPEKDIAVEEEQDDVATEAVVETASWDYGAEHGPQDWGLMSEEYAACSEGVEQSPIDLQPGAATADDLAELQFSWSGDDLKVEDTGLGFKASPGGEHTLTIGDDTYKLLQFHAHTPSEHTLDGKSFPMEIHFVHQNDAGELAVVGVMIEEGATSEVYNPIVTAASSGGGSATIGDIMALLPSEYGYFTYPGSLTTPPCSEGVRWIVLKESIELGADQIAVFKNAHGTTNRPVQPLGARVVRTGR